MKQDSLRSANILLVDDEVSCLCLMENVLNRLGFANIRKVTSAKAALLEIDAHPPDLVITDISMPVMDGLELITRLRVGFPDELLLPVIVVSGSASPQNKRRALAVGATDILSKPFDSAEIFMRIRASLRSRSLHIALQDQNALLEQKVAERTRELRESQDQVVQRERFRAFGEMAGGVVHDFNNALVSVIGYSELLLTDEDSIRNPDLVREYLQIMLTAGRDATHVVARLRDFYRPRGNTDVFAAVDLNSLISEAVALTQPKWRDQAHARGVTIEVSLELERVPHVFGCGAELREVLMNLIFNAVDAMGDSGRIIIRTRALDEIASVEVSDTGCGMTAEVRQRCLEPFFSTKGEAGTGLGLSMVFGIIKRHDAQIEIESEPGRGTTVRLQFPVPDLIAPEAPDARGVPQPSLKVLVVDDDRVTRDIITKYLKSDGYEVECADSGEAAMERLNSQDIDLLITDHGMPGMNGLQLLETSRTMGHRQPAILMSGSSLDPAVKPEIIRAFLPKPVRKKELQNVIRDIAFV